MSRIWMSHVSHMNESCLFHSICVGVCYRWRRLRVFCRYYKVVPSYASFVVPNKKPASFVVPNFFRIRETRLSHTWDMTHSYMRHDSFIRVFCSTQQENSAREYEWVMSHIWMSHVSRMTESCLTYTKKETSEKVLLGMRPAPNLLFTHLNGSILLSSVVASWWLPLFRRSLL